MAYMNTIEKLGDKATLDAFITGTITEFRDDSITTLATDCLRDQANITLLDFSALTSIPAGAFNGTSLTTLILRKTTIINLTNKNALQYTPIANGTGYIYVPKALIEKYKTATNWSTYANQFRAIEDYTVDGTITGELDESKI